MATYTELVDKVLAWANRDTKVLNIPLIKDCINFAADEAYRSLRVAPLEHTVRYEIDESADCTSNLNIPADAIEFIQLNLIDGNKYYPYSAKLDIRSFREVVELIDGGPRTETARGIQDIGSRFWTRDTGDIVIYPPMSANQVYELYYYRRLSAPDARYTATASTIMADPDVTDHATPTVWSPLESYTIGNRVLLDTTYYEALLDIAASVTWDPSVTYAIGDLVEFQGANYTAAVANLKIDAWTGQAPYALDQVVSFMGLVYQLNSGSVITTGTEENPNPNPVEDTDNWTLITNHDPDISDDWTLNTTFNPDTADSTYWNALALTDFNVDGLLFYYNAVDSDTLIEYFDTQEPNARLNDEDIAPFEITEASTGVPTGFYIGKLSGNWLRDENEKALLFGALSQAFDYLDEADQAQKYMAKFEKEIFKLNDEDNKRIPSGGTVPVIYGSPLL